MTIFAPHTAQMSIMSGKLTFDERVVLHRVKNHLALGVTDPVRIIRDKSTVCALVTLDAVVRSCAFRLRDFPVRFS